MKKSMLLVMVALFAVSAHAQDGGSKSLTIYADGSSGVLNPDAKGNTRTFNGNELETGLTYNQSFGNGLSYFIKGRVIGEMPVTNEALTVGAGEDSKNADTRGTYEYRLSGTKGFRVTTGIGYGINGFSTGVSINSCLLATASVGYSMSFGSAGSLALGSDVEFFMIPSTYYTGDLTTGYGSKPSDAADYTKTVTNQMGYIVDLFQVHIGYTVPFAERWSFNTKAMFRFTGTIEDSGVYTDMNAFMFGQSFRIRWDNTISVKATDNLSLYGRVRYEARDLVKKQVGEDSEGVQEDKWVAADVDHRVSLHVGMAYTFDF